MHICIFFVTLYAIVCHNEIHTTMDNIKQLIGLPKNAVIEYKSARGGLPASLDSKSYEEGKLEQVYPKQQYRVKQ